jgi:hypothetical protein
MRVGGTDAFKDLTAGARGVSVDSEITPGAA